MLRQPIVVAVAGDGRAVGAGDRLLLTLQRAGEQCVGERLAREQPRAVPGEREGGTVGAAAQRIGGGDGERDAAARLLDGVAAGDRLDEGALAIGGPAVVAAGGRSGSGVRVGSGWLVGGGLAGDGQAGGVEWGERGHRRHSPPERNSASIARAAATCSGASGAVAMRPASTCACHSRHGCSPLSGEESMGKAG